MSNSKDQGVRVFNFASALPQTLYWDANFIVNSAHADARWHKECESFNARLLQSQTISYVSTLALDESWFTLLQFMINDDYPDKLFWRIVNDDPSVITDYVDRLEKITEDFYANPQIRVVSISSRAPRRALKNMREFHLLPRDAMHLAAMRQHKIEHIVTTDADFLSVSGISIFTCNPAILAS